MAGLIPQSFIDDLLNRIDIIDVISDRITLKKAGRNHQALCPFHKEKSPSFSANQDKQFYYCFGCGASGNALGFIMDHDHIDFPEAVELLARQAGMQVPREAAANDRRERTDPLYDQLKAATRWYTEQLLSHNSAAKAKAYLNQRGLNQETIARFQIGYAPPGWDNLIKALGNTPEREQLLNKAGLVVENDERKTTYDRFRDRIIFPIRDLRGRVIAFGGRVLGDEKPKYLNSPETTVFHKGRELYGFYEARQANRDLQQVLVVEGYMDVIALAQQGINNAVATLGTATSTDHLLSLFKHTSQIVFCFDGDNAGRQAAWRALDNALPVMSDGRQIRFLFLPQGEDPDSLVRREGAKAFLARLSDRQQALTFDDYFFKFFENEIDTTTLDGKARLVHKVTPFIHRLPEGSFKSLMVKKLGEISDLGTSAVSSIIQSDINTTQAAQNHNHSVGEYGAPGYESHGSGYGSSSYGSSSYGSSSSGYDYGNQSYDHGYNGYTDDSGRGSRNGGRDQSYRKNHQRNYQNKFSADPYRNRRNLSAPAIKMRPQQTALRILLDRPDLANTVNVDELSAITGDDDIRFLVMLTEALLRHPVESTYGVLGSWYGTNLGNRLLELMKLDSPIDNTEQIFRQCLKHLLDSRQKNATELNDMDRLRILATGEKTGWLERKQRSQQENETKH